MPEFILQEVLEGCFVWEKTESGWDKIDFFDSLDLAQEIFPEAKREPLPPDLITDTA